MLGAMSEDGVRFLTTMDDSAKALPLTVALPFLRAYGLGQYIPGTIGHIFKQFQPWEDLTRGLFRRFQPESKNDITERFIATPLLLKEDSFLGRQLSQDEA